MSLSGGDVFLDPTNQSVADLFSREISGPLTMLNLLRLRETAGYTGSPDLAPVSPISGRQACEKYIEHTLPYLQATGGELSYLGVGGRYLIGPENEGWDLVMLVRQSSIQDLLSFASNEGYLKGVGHRIAAVWDSRILSLEDVPLES